MSKRVRPKKKAPKKKTARKKMQAPAQPIEGRTWMSVLEVADYIGISKKNVYRFIKNDTIPWRRIGKLYKFYKPDVDDWMISGYSADADISYERHV